MHYSTDTFRLMSWQGLLAALCLVFLTQFVISLIRAIYNLYFHPLSKVPGPRSWIAIPIIREFAQLRGRHDFEVKALHERYGPIVRIGVDSLSFTSASAWKDIYGHGHAELPKYIPDFYTKLVSTNIINANARDHFRFRRAMLPAFADRALDQQEHIIRAYVDLLVEKLSGQAKVGKPTNMVNWYTYTTFDLIGDLAYGTSFDGLKEGKQNDWIRNIDNMMRMFPILVLATSSPIISKLLMFFASDKIKNSQEEHKRLSTDLTMTRIKNKDMDRRGDFMDLMMRAQGKDHGLTDAELAANSDVLIVAGSETTATLLSGATYYMLKNPACLQKCVEEVRSAFASDADITFKAASAKLPYMLACLDEALRLFPPLPTISLRVTPPGQVSVIDGVEVPGKTKVGVHHLSTYHSEANFHDAKSFHPERWLPQAQSDPSSPYFNDCREACQPFSVGPRNCIGRNLAYHEMRLILAKVLWNFDLKLRQESREWAESQRTFQLWEKTPLMVEIQERER